MLEPPHYSGGLVGQANPVQLLNDIETAKTFQKNADTRFKEGAVLLSHLRNARDNAVTRHSSLRTAVARVRRSTEGNRIQLTKLGARVTRRVATLAALEAVQVYLVRVADGVREHIREKRGAVALEEYLERCDALYRRLSERLQTETASATSADEYRASLVSELQCVRETMESRRGAVQQLHMRRDVLLAQHERLTREMSRQHTEVEETASAVAHLTAQHDVLAEEADRSKDHIYASVAAAVREAARRCPEEGLNVETPSTCLPRSESIPQGRMEEHAPGHDIGARVMEDIEFVASGGRTAIFRIIDASITRGSSFQAQLATTNNDVDDALRRIHSLHAQICTLSGNVRETEVANETVLRRLAAAEGHRNGLRYAAAVIEAETRHIEDEVEACQARQEAYVAECLRARIACEEFMHETEALQQKRAALSHAVRGIEETIEQHKQTLHTTLQETARLDLLQPEGAVAAVPETVTTPNDVTCVLDALSLTLEREEEALARARRTGEASETAIRTTVQTTTVMREELKRLQRETEQMERTATALEAVVASRTEAVAAAEAAVASASKEAAMATEDLSRLKAELENQRESERATARAAAEAEIEALDAAIRACNDDTKVVAEARAMLDDRIRHYELALSELTEECDTTKTEMKRNFDAEVQRLHAEHAAAQISKGSMTTASSAPSAGLVRLYCNHCFFSLLESILRNRDGAASGPHTRSPTLMGSISRDDASGDDDDRISVRALSSRRIKSSSASSRTPR